jgi:SHS2 domain-containing protein
VYRWLEHTAELALELDAASDEEVFRDALAAFAELVEGHSGGEPLRVPVELAAAARADLLVAWLEELVFLADTELLVPEAAEVLEVRENRVRAVVTGRRDAPRPIVKAVTYHDLEFRREGGRSRAHVVFDV